MKPQRLNKEDWDHLIVLDACRYDYFEDRYPEYLSGNLEKRKSRGSCTKDWLKNTFRSNYDYVYFSTNPYINSKGVEFSGWKADEHFSEIVDLWLDRWDEEKGTVHPKEVNEAVVEHSDENKRSIIHYMQPHRPYLSAEISGTDWINREDIMEEDEEKRLFGDFRDMLGQSLTPIKKYWSRGTFFWKIRKWIDMDPAMGFENIWREYGTEGVRELYEDNLNTALSYVKELTKELDGSVVVTSDHG